MNVCRLSIFIMFFMLSSFNLYAQGELPRKEGLKIDADFSDWREDSLQYHYEDQGLNYSVANDSQYLYVFIRVPDKGQQLKAIYNGFNVTVNPQAKEKAGPSVIFPLPDVAALRAVNEENDQNKALDRREFGLNTVRAIYVRGFEDIVDGMISINNHYGIHISAQIDSADVLNYEMAVSLDQLKIEPGNPFAINFRINEIITTRYTDPGFRRYRYGYPYYGMNTYGRSGVSRKEVPGSWHIVLLAN